MDSFLRFFRSWPFWGGFLSDLYLGYQKLTWKELTWVYVYLLRILTKFPVWTGGHWRLNSLDFLTQFFSLKFDTKVRFDKQNDRNWGISLYWVEVSQYRSRMLEYSLSQWLNFKLSGITCLVGKIKFKLLSQGPLAEWEYVKRESTPGPSAPRHHVGTAALRGFFDRDFFVGTTRMEKRWCVSWEAGEAKRGSGFHRDFGVIHGAP